MSLRASVAMKFKILPALTNIILHFILSLVLPKGLLDHESSFLHLPSVTNDIGERYVSKGADDISSD